MGTLVDYRAALRLDLNDPAGGSQRFADGDLDRAVARVVAELSLACPREIDNEHTLAAASRVVPLSGAPYAGVLVGVSEVEVPYGVAGVDATMPPTLVPFRLAPDKLSMLLIRAETPAVGDHIRVRYQAAYSITVGATTVPVEWDVWLQGGAYAYACLAYSTPLADNFRYEDGAAVAQVDDSMIPREWRARFGEAWRTFRAELERLRAVRISSGRRWVSWGERPEAPEWPEHQRDGGREP